MSKPAADPEGEVIPPDPTIRITIEHSSYYQRIPVPEANVFDDTVEDAGPVPEDKIALSRTTEATFPGYRMYNAVIQSPEPVVTVTDVDLLSLARINDDRIAAGLAKKRHHQNLTRLLEDAAWVEHFPLDSIVAIRCDDPKWEKWLNDHFLGDGDDDLGGGVK